MNTLAPGQNVAQLAELALKLNSYHSLVEIANLMVEKEGDAKEVIESYKTLEERTYDAVNELV